MEIKKYYRVCHKDTLQGLWYDYKGNFTGLIHDQFNLCKNNELRMEFDDEIVGWLSATDSPRYHNWHGISQPKCPPPPQHEWNHQCWPPPCIPINKGLCFLLIGGLCLGLYNNNLKEKQK